MIFQETKLQSCYIIKPKLSGDERGWFMRTFCKETFQSHNIVDCDFVQSNHSYTGQTGTIRGLHYQKEPAQEAKLIRCLRGKVFDVAVDLRPDSSTLHQWISCILSAENKSMIYIPKGFAHGFQSMEPDTELIYQHTNAYDPKLEAGILYNDPKLKITWPLAVTHISERDTKHSLL